MRRLLAALFSLALISSLYLTPAASAAAPAQATLDAVDAYIQASVKAAHIPGLAVGIVQDQQVVFVKGYGTAGAGRPVTPDTPMIIGSTSKSFTALAVMQLVEAGKVDLDAPVQKYLPEFRTADAEASKQVTVRQLLNQTSGLSTADGRLPLLKAGAQTLTGLVESLQAVKLPYPPGQVYQYSNLNYCILGLLVERVSGQPYGAYLKANVLDPLGMRSSGTSPAEVKELATGYHMWFGFAAGADEPFLPSSVPAGYIIASARDLSNYLIAQLNEGSFAGKSVLSPAGVQAMHTAGARIDDTSGYGMGWRIGQADGMQVVRHDGEIANFHSELYMLPDRKTGIVLVTNVTHILTSNVVARMPQDIAGLLTGSSAPKVNRGLWPVYQLVYLAVVVALLLMPLGWRRLPERLRRSRRSAWLRVGAAVVLNLILALGLWFGVPVLTGAPLALMFHFHPDVAWLLVAVAGMNLLGAAVRLGIAFTTLWHHGR